MESLVVLITCHNRKEKTLKCLQHLLKVSLPSGIKSHIILLDDGSTDNTSKEVKERFPAVEILEGDGTLYWAGGMRKLIEHVLTEGFDYCLWLNDDTYLFKESINELWTDLKNHEFDAIISGATQDPITKQVTYGGFRRKIAWSPLHLKLVPPEETLNLELETINGNCLLLSHDVLKRVGNLDKYFTHGLADLDFGFRARRKGVKLILSKKYVAFCERNLKSNIRTAKGRVKEKTDVKNMPWKEWKYYVKKNGGFFWPYYLIAPYLKSLIPK